MFAHTFLVPDRLFIAAQYLGVQTRDQDSEPDSETEFIDELDPHCSACPKPIKDDYDIGKGEEHERKRKLPPGFDLKNELFGPGQIVGWVPYLPGEQTGSGSGFSKSATSSQTQKPKDKLSQKLAQLSSMQLPQRDRQSVNRVVRFIQQRRAQTK
jgi:hypothetical protein